MSRRIILSIAVVLAFLSNWARAHTEMEPRPYAHRRLVEPSGRFYVAIQPLSKDNYHLPWPVSITLAERNPDLSPVFPGIAVVRKIPAAQTPPGPQTPATHKQAVGASSKVGRSRSPLPALNPHPFRSSFEIVNPENGSLRLIDRVLGTFSVERAPTDLFISSRGTDVAVINGYAEYADRKQQVAAVLFSPQRPGLLIKNLSDLFSVEQIGKFPRSYDWRVDWYAGGWIDSESRRLVIVGSELRREAHQPEAFPPVAVIDLETGEPRPGDARDILQAISASNPDGLQPALDLAKQFKLGEAIQHLPQIIENEKLPLGARARAGVLLAASGDKRGAEVLRKAALTESLGFPQDFADPMLRTQMESVTDYAILNLSAVLGKDSLATLHQTARRHSSVTVKAFQTIGAEATPVLLSMLRNGNPNDQLVAAAAFESIRPVSPEVLLQLINLVNSSARSNSGWGIREPVRVTLSKLGRPAQLGPLRETAVPVITLAMNTLKAELSLRKGRVNGGWEKLCYERDEHVCHLLEKMLRDSDK